MVTVRIKKASTLLFNSDIVKPQEEWSGNSNLHFVFEEMLCENNNKINKGGKMDHFLAKQNPSVVIKVFTLF